MAHEPTCGAAAQAAPKMPTAPDAAAAFERIRDEIAALPAEEIRPMNVDVPRAVAIGVAAAPRVLALRSEAKRQLPEFDISNFDKLETYVFGTYYAHLLTIPPPKTESEKAALVAEATPLKEQLLGDAEALARRGHVDGELVAAIRKGRGHLDLAGDCIALSALFLDAWDRVENKTAATLEEIRRANTIGSMLFVALHREVLAPKAEMSPGERRARAFTLLHRAYDQCRRAVTFLRWSEGDAEIVAPSLYSRGPRRARVEAADEAAEGSAAG